MKYEKLQVFVLVSGLGLSFHLTWDPEHIIEWAGADRGVSELEIVVFVIGYT